MNRIRAWIDAKVHRPLIAAIAICEAPVVVGGTIVFAVVGAPWYSMPIVIVGFFLLIGWIALVMAALTRWFE